MGRAGEVARWKHCVVVVGKDTLCTLFLWRRIMMTQKAKDDGYWLGLGLSWYVLLRIRIIWYVALRSIRKGIVQDVHVQPFFYQATWLWRGQAGKFCIKQEFRAPGRPLGLRPGWQIWAHHHHCRVEGKIVELHSVVHHTALDRTPESVFWGKRVWSGLVPGIPPLPPANKAPGQWSPFNNTRPCKLIQYRNPRITRATMLIPYMVSTSQWKVIEFSKVQQL